MGMDISDCRGNIVCHLSFNKIMATVQLYTDLDIHVGINIEENKLISASIFDIKLISLLYHKKFNIDIDLI